MDFASIGNVRTWARMSNLKFAANHRLKTGQSLVGSNGQLNFSTLGRSSFVDQMMKSQKQSGDEISKKRLAAIKRKLMSGKKLSNEEMGYLMRHDSKLYNKAKRVEEAREELKSDLRQAKSKAEARKALTRAIMKASAECTAELDAAQRRAAEACRSEVSTADRSGLTAELFPSIKVFPIKVFPIKIFLSGSMRKLRPLRLRRKIICRRRRRRRTRSRPRTTFLRST